MKTHLLLATLAVAGLAACGSAPSSPAVASNSSSSSTTSASSPAATPQATPAVATAKAASPLATWCTLSLGEAKAAVLSAMGTPNGHAADSYKSLLGPGMTQAEWDTSGDILLATFDASGKAYNLQAYAGAVGPQGATNIGCTAFRS